MEITETCNLGIRSERRLELFGEFLKTLFGSGKCAIVLMKAVRKMPPVMKEVHFSDDGTSAKFTFPSLGCDFMNDDGNIFLWKVFKLFESTRVFAVLHPGFCIYKELPPPKWTFFVVLLDLDIEQQLYEKAQNKGWHMPVELSIRVIGFGDKSIEYISFMKDPEDEVLLAMMRIKSVLVSPITRKSAHIPPSLKVKVGKYLKPELAMRQYIPCPRPNEGHCLPVTVRLSDTDHNDHLNNSAYVRFCMDCASDAACQGKLKHFSRAISHYRAKQVTTFYQRECRLGDSLHVYCWEDANSSEVLHFAIMKNDQYTFQCQAQYYQN